MLRALVVSFAMLAASWPLRGETGARQQAATLRQQAHPQSNSAAGAPHGEDSAAENELLEAANKSRELAGVAPLRMDESLREAARAHARRMVASEQSGASVARASRAAGENCAGEFPTGDRSLKSIVLARTLPTPTALRVRMTP